MMRPGVWVICEMKPWSVSSSMTRAARLVAGKERTLGRLGVRLASLDFYQIKLK